MTNTNASIFYLPKKQANNLGIYEQKSKIMLRDRFIELFRKGKEEHIPHLTLNQLVCGYYNLFTKPNNEDPIYRERFMSRLRYWIHIYNTGYSNDREKINDKDTPRPFIIKHHLEDTYELVE